MKKVSLFALFAMSAFAADFKGTVSDAKCGAAHASGDAKAQKCVAKCVGAGGAAVLVTEDGKVLKLNDAAKVAEHLGHKVVITGDLDGETLKIASVKMQ